jgi:GT2 family glycosyltransferase
VNTRSLPVSVVIPTYRREAVLVESVEALLALEAPPAEIVLVDQTEAHEPQTEARLGALVASGLVRVIRQRRPSIPQAMNAGLLQARHPLVLFLDDDIRPEAGLIAAHEAAHRTHGDVLVAGKVLQPWDEGRQFAPDAPFHFASAAPAWIREFMGGNFSVRRDSALALGGFDENFVRVAYRFEAEFAHRWLAGGRRIRYESAACIHHLKVASGGTRTFGEHLTTWRPAHAVGAYYFGLRTRAWREFASRPFRSVATRYHLKHPWRIPVTLFAEFCAMAWAIALFAHGPRYAKGRRA